MCTVLLVKYPLYLSEFNETNFRDRFWKYLTRKFVQWKAEFCADGQTDKQAGRQDEANGGFRNFANALKKGWSRFMIGRDGLDYCGSK